MAQRVNHFCDAFVWRLLKNTLLSIEFLKNIHQLHA